MTTEISATRETIRILVGAAIQNTALYHPVLNSVGAIITPREEGRESFWDIKAQQYLRCLGELFIKTHGAGAMEALCEYLEDPKPADQKLHELRTRIRMVPIGPVALGLFGEIEETMAPTRDAILGQLAGYLRNVYCAA